MGNPNEDNFRVPGLILPFFDNPPDVEHFVPLLGPGDEYFENMGRILIPTFIYIFHPHTYHTRLVTYTPVPAHFPYPRANLWVFIRYNLEFLYPFLRNPIEAFAILVTTDRQI